ncbi:response regulator [Thauera mechernichensis]|uniref:Response regulator n=1 Tax=Thauera mechernichensis TaxID=82788 RepID=A0ABW3WI99_9RHOO|nr:MULTISPECIES: response regulator transcription factor [Betaproteobacteria]ENO93619.1 LuxR family transcriptional regulator [Thauera sp. 28]MDG3065160.1 response regulator transcription factor [Thauera mechernichensis]HAG76914.1 DNA-binding response regulator [Thauera sp.]HNR84649.1 response regulator transcription factor [Ottowia sp.]HRJ24974.1 response regulator transcription factor [Thauera sp.]
MLRIAIVDDHQIVRAGFREMLADELGFEFPFEAASGEEALQGLREHETDVLLLDLSLPGQSGVDVLRAARQRYDKLRILVLSGFPEERYALAMIRNGADGYLCKDCTREDLINAIRTVAQGRRYLSPRTAELLAETLAGGASGAAHDKLSDRELQVFLRLARGESVSDIAGVLSLSVKTVSTYRTRLLEKLGVASNAELATYALRHGLILE